MKENYMEIPKMVLFDYGQTLISEQKFDGVKGTEAVLQYATRNKYHLSAEQVQAKANEINREFGRFDPEKRHLFQIEIPNTMFTPYLYESQGIEIALSNSEIDTVFWNAAAPGTPTEGIKDFLKYLKSKGIRTGVISNISYAPSVVAERINRLLPENAFEFIITSSNFIFRKPNKRIFDLALEKADLRPDEVWYIGDQYECDIKGSLNAGLLPVWYIGAIDLPYTKDENILTVKTWSEVERYMERLSVAGEKTMPNPWEEIPLSDYENHMKLDSVMQLQTMNHMMKGQLNAYPVSSAIILGIAGGNGLEHIDKNKFQKVYGIDINSEYLNTVRERYSDISDILECVRLDLIQESNKLPKAELLIANLLIEYIGYECFRKAVEQIQPKYVSCIIQINIDNSWVSDSPYIHTFDSLSKIHHQLEEELLIKVLNSIEYKLIGQTERLLPNGKKLVQLDFALLSEKGKQQAECEYSFT